MSRHVVAAARDIPPGGRRLVSVRGRPIAVFNLKGEYFALLNRCPHQGGSLCEGAITGLVLADQPGEYRYERVGEIIRCPWHGWEFDIRTGQSWCEPSRIATKQYQVEVAAGASVVQGPYVAETLAVSVEENYIVVEV
jgi:3-phenylpropionate/trans-cinnamate dioxygenase ferredoxin subunit